MGWRETVKGRQDGEQRLVRCFGWWIIDISELVVILINSRIWWNRKNFRSLCWIGGQDEGSRLHCSQPSDLGTGKDHRRLDMDSDSKQDGHWVWVWIHNVGSQSEHITGDWMDVSLRRDKDGLQGTREPLVDFQKGRNTNWFLYQGSLENNVKECASTDAGTNSVFEEQC